MYPLGGPQYFFAVIRIRFHISVMTLSSRDKAGKPLFEPKSILDPRHEKTCFCICRNEGEDQLLSVSYIDSTIPLLPKSEIASL